MLWPSILVTAQCNLHAVTARVEEDCATLPCCPYTGSGPEVSAPCALRVAVGGVKPTCWVVEVLGEAQHCGRLPGGGYRVGLVTALVTSRAG